jgi:hypothetical protein
MPLPWKKPSYLERRAEWLASQTFVVLAIHVPKDNEKNAASAEQFFAALHGIYRNDPVVQEHVSFEIVAQKDSITFYVFTPLHLRDFIEGQLYAQYPDLQITQVSDYTKSVELDGMHVGYTKVQLTKEDVYPIKTFISSEVDPLAGITAVLTGLEGKERVWLQIVVRPIGDEWQEKGVSFVNAVRSGQTTKGGGVVSMAGRVLSRLAKEIITPGAGVGDTTTAAEPPKLSAPQEAALKGIESKITKLGFETIIRLTTIAPDPLMAKAKVQSVLAALKQFNTTNLNGFTGGEILLDNYPAWEQYINREFEEKGNILNIEELASLYHFPTQSVESSSIAWAGSKKGDAPFNLPLKENTDARSITILGKTDFRDQKKEFGIKMLDRMRHMYIIGKSGTGKSTLLENMAIDDVIEGRGIIVVDPHGEFADKVINSIPESRIQDVVVIDPSDREWPVAFNILENVGEDYKGIVASGFVGIFKKIFGNSWGPRLEYILRNTVLAILDSENPTMLGIPRMLTDPQFRNWVVAQVKDSVIRDFWETEFAAMDIRQRTEAVAPILNKVGQFLSTSTIRNIVGQPKSTIDIRKIMDEQKILIVNLSKGKIGEDNMALLGSMIITKVQLAAMSRANVDVTERPPCFLYVDEFQNFATESFATILSEARKYNLGLTIAHQYVKQMPEEVKNAVVGNVGTIILFRVGAEDAEALQKEFAPVFEVADMINLTMAHVYIKLLIDGMSAPAFSAVTLPPVKVEGGHRQAVLDWSRSQYASSREVVETLVEEVAGLRMKREMKEAAQAAHSILTQGASSISIDAQRGRQVAIQKQAQSIPAVQPPSVQSAVAMQSEEKPPLVIEQTPFPVVSEAVQKPNVLEATNTGIPEEGVNTEQGKVRMHEDRQSRPLRTLNGWVYREVSQKGGMRWFLGEKESEYKKRLEEKQRLKELEKQEEPERGRGTEVAQNINQENIVSFNTDRHGVDDANKRKGQTVGEGEMIEQSHRSKKSSTHPPTNEQNPNGGAPVQPFVLPNSPTVPVDLPRKKGDDAVISIMEGQSLKL